MPAEPASASGLRPIRSTRAIVTTVPTTLTIEVERLISSELLSSMPTDCHRKDE